MLASLRHRLGKIMAFIRREGVMGYLRRLYELGEYKHQWRRILYAHRLRCSEVRLSGYRLALPQRNPGIKEELVLYGVHEPFATSLYRQLLRPGDVIFDVGTNLGYYIMVADQALNGHCTVHGFEPDPELFQIARRNSTGFRLQAVLNPVAATDRNGSVLFHRSSVANWGTLVPQKDLRITETVEVTGIRLDDYSQKVRAIPTVLRMDIEGGELLALRGSVGILRSVQLIFLELHCIFLEPHEMDELFLLLTEAGFDQAIWSNRYYDWPWSRQNAQARHLRRGDLAALAQFSRQQEYGVLSAFILRTASQRGDPR